MVKVKPLRYGPPFYLAMLGKLALFDIPDNAFVGGIFLRPLPLHYSMEVILQL